MLRNKRRRERGGIYHSPTALCVYIYIYILTLWYGLLQLSVIIYWENRIKEEEVEEEEEEVEEEEEECCSKKESSFSVL